MARCKICGTPGKACGGPTHIVVPDPLPTQTQGGIMAELKRYNFTDSTRRGSQPTILLLNADDAKRLGLTDKDLADKKSTGSASTSSGSGSGSGSRSRSSRSTKAKTSKATKPSTAPATAPAAAAQDDGSGSTGS